MTGRIKKASAKAIIGFSAIFLIALFIIYSGGKFVKETIMRKNGSLVSETLSVTDFQMNSFKAGENGTFVTTDDDPQLILEGSRYISSIKFYMEYTIQPGEIVRYYTQKDGQGFSERKRVWAKPVAGEDGWYEIDMGGKNIKSLRIDPTMYGGNILKFGDFRFNSEKTPGDFFALRYTHIYIFIVYTVILSAIIRFIQELLIKFSK